MTERLLILYGSQTKQAESISEQIYDKCISQLDALADINVKIDRFCLDKTDKEFFIEKEKTIIFIVSTTGEGDPPESAERFYRRLKRKTHPPNHLSHLSYTLLALGDTNYDRFANFGKNLDQRLEQLGAKQFYHTGYGDDAVGLEIGVEPWIDNLFQAVLLHYQIFTQIQVPKIDIAKLQMNDNRLEPNLTNSSISLAEMDQLTLPLIPGKFSQLKVTFHDENEECKKLSFYFEQLPIMESSIFNGTIIDVKELTQSNDKKVLEATFQVDDDDFPSYEPGDSFGLITGNSDEEVECLLKQLDFIDKSQLYCQIEPANLFKHLPPIVKLWDLIKYYVELRSVAKKSCLRHFAEFCSDQVQKRRLYELSSREGADEYNKFIRTPSVGILDLLKEFNSCKPSLEALIANIPCFTPRYYSVSNAPQNEKDHQFKAAFTVINLAPICNRTGSQLYGVTTGYFYRVFWSKNDINESLAQLNLNGNEVPKIKLFKRKNPYFKLPKNALTPLILVGPGTGVAPFIGFLEQRKKLKNLIPIGETWLFFGCRTSQDFIYKNQLESFTKDHILTRLCVCLSREPNQSDDSPKYVQDLLMKEGNFIFKLIHSKKAMIYVCGDVKMMSVNVFNAFVKIAEEFGKMNHENAVKYIRELQSEKKYLQDVWL